MTTRANEGQTLDKTGAAKSTRSKQTDTFQRFFVLFLQWHNNFILFLGRDN